MNIKDAKRLIKKLYEAQMETGQRFSVELVGGPGVGKSQAIAQVAKELAKSTGKEFGFRPFFLSTLEQPDVRGFGLPSKDSDGTAIMTYTRAPWMPRATDPEQGILFLDEFRQAGHDVQKPAAELLLNGRVGDSHLPPGWMVVAASNREKDRSGVQRELMFITNRRMEVQVEGNLSAWAEWAERNGVAWQAIAFAKARPGIVFREEVPSEGGAFCTPRSLVQVSHLLERLDDKLFVEAAAGLIGEGAASELAAFIRVIDQLPAFEDIIADPEGCRLPDDDRPDAQYACMQMLAARVDKKNAKAVFTYLSRLPKEFQVAGLKSALRVHPAIVNNADVGKWMQENHGLVMAAGAV